jgi:hypothetical protein
MPRLVWTSSFALVLMLAGSAHADIVVPRSRVRAVPSAQLVLLSGSGERGVPDEDVSRVQSGVRAHVSAQRRRVQQCLVDVDLREDPMRTRARRVELRVRVGRDGRGRAVVHRNAGMPAGAVRCLREAAAGVNVRPPPRGEVVVRLVYELR